MPTEGWKRLVDGWPWFRGENSYPLAAYSEFMPSPRFGRKPYGWQDSLLFHEDDPFGWHVTEYEESFELRSGLEKIAQQIVGSLNHLGHGRPAHGISQAKLQGNPYWPPELAERAGHLPHERYVTLAPLSLSRTQDDKGRYRWTLFGGSEQGPARGFWRSFFTAPRREIPAEQALDFFRRLLHEVYGEPVERLKDLHSAGFRILPREKDAGNPLWHGGNYPRWTKPLLWARGQSIAAVKYLLTFQPFAELPAPVRRAYLKGDLHLLPFPGSLVFWGAQGYHDLQRELPFALQIPLQHSVARHEGWRDLRVPQSGWLHEPRPGHEHPSADYGPFRNTFKRTNRWAKVLRFEDELALTGREEKLTHVLFSSSADDCGLYGKPMARNVQIWTRDWRLLLDGPRATHADIERAIEAIERGGYFGYRMHYPAMRVGKHVVYWHRPMVAYLSRHTGQPAMFANAPLGYLTAYRTPHFDLARPVELWPRMLTRELPHTALEIFQNGQHRHPFQSVLNVRKLTDTRILMGDQALPRSFARSLLSIPKQLKLEDWLAQLPEQSDNHERGRWLSTELKSTLEPDQAKGSNKGKLPRALTYHRTARRAWEVSYWKTIAHLAEGEYLTKNNADVVRDSETQKKVCHLDRDLDLLGDYLLDYYRRVVAEAGMTGRALVGDLPFKWRTDFHYSWMGGWLGNQEGIAEERDLIVVIPGRDRSLAIIMGDHYDTAYMADCYEKEYGGNGARLAAAGADDNHSATAALMLGAPIFLELSKEGQLSCDIWLIHLTGEEFPADCLGARHLTQSLVEGTLRMRLPGGKSRDLSKTRIQGLYVLDMVAHNNDHDRDIFQISPGTGPQAMWLAYQAHVANMLWNAGAQTWNLKKDRRDAGRSRRSPRGSIIPEVARHPELQGGVRPPYDPRSTLYNTDGQIFSDAGIPAVLFMENYDINRTGYHDTHDTMENIDLDYGSAVAAITIESVARAATEEVG